MRASWPVMLCAAASSASTTCGYVALLVIAGAMPRPSLSVAALLCADCVVPLLGGSLIGAQVDRRRPRLVAALSAAALCALALVMAAASGSFLLLAACAVVAGGAGAALSTSLQTAAAGSAATLGRFSAAAQAGTLAGPALAGGAMALWGPASGLVCQAALAGVCVLCCRLLPGAAAGPRDHEAQRASWRVVWRVAGARALVVCVTAAALAGAMINVAEPLLARSLGFAQTGMALIACVFAGGFIAGSLAAGAGDLRRRRGRWYAAGLAAQAAALALIAASPWLWAVLSAVCLTGAANGWAMTHQRALVSESVPASLHGSAFSLMYGAQSGAFVVALAAAGVLGGLSGPRAVFAVSALGMGLAAVLAAVTVARRRRVLA